MLQLDGSRGEGGGQMVRTALALSALTGRPFRMEHIRVGRPQPGLKAQHLQAIKALQAICMVLWAESPSALLGADALGERGKPAETAGLEAAQKLSKFLSTGASVDEHLADQLIPYLALCPGSSLWFSYSSGHMESNIEMTEQFLPVKFEREGNMLKIANGKI